ncbi:MAG TPA: aromatic ring-opening dioxygenase LigA, partial [Cellulomonas sp.]
DDPLRETAMTASFLRGSLFTSVVAFGVAALVMGLGVLFILVGYAIFALAGRRVATVAEPIAPVEPGLKA